MTTEDRDLREACGVVGVYSRGEDVARVAFFGLYALQHRGQESAGIAASDGERIRVHTAMGLVAQTLDEETLLQLPGHIAIGHTRYSTMGSNTESNAQPLISDGPQVKIALAHNGKRHQRAGAEGRVGRVGLHVHLYQRLGDHRPPSYQRARQLVGGASGLLHA